MAVIGKINKSAWCCRYIHAKGKEVIPGLTSTTEPGHSQPRTTRCTSHHGSEHIRCSAERRSFVRWVAITVGGVFWVIVIAGGVLGGSLSLDGVVLWVTVVVGVCVLGDCHCRGCIGEGHFHLGLCCG